ncbi:MAG: hypothetical protein V4481_00060 [Patescibacteria group bacterium]
MQRNSGILSKEMAEAAVAILRPGIEQLIKDQNRMAVAIVILDPAGVAAYQGPQDDLPILLETVIGNPDRTQWKSKFDESARKKATISLRTRMSTHLVAADQPYLFENGDFKYGGSDVRGYQITASGGLAWEYDYLISAALNAIMQALSLAAMRIERENKACSHIGERP